MNGGSNISKVWFRFTKSIKNGERVQFRVEQLPQHRFEEFLDFNMKYYVKHEATHVVAEIYKNPKAMEEYRQITSKLFRNPSYHNAICCVDDKTNKLVGCSTVKLLKKGDVYKDVMQAKTAEVQRFYEILHNWNNLCPVPDIMKRYEVDQFLDDAGIAIHPNYRGYSLTTETLRSRDAICKEYNVPLTGAWITAIEINKTTKKEGWETVYEIGSKELERFLGVKFPNASKTFVYKVKRYFSMEE